MIAGDDPQVIPKIWEEPIHSSRYIGDLSFPYHGMSEKWTYKKLIIVTAGGLARAVYSNFKSNYEIVCFLDKPRVPGEEIYGIPVQEYAPQDYDGKYIIACGSPWRRIFFDDDIGGPWAKLIHPQTTVSPFAEIGEGCILEPGVRVDPDVILNRHVYLDYNTVIGHGAEIGAYTVISPGTLVAGYCQLGEKVYVGANASIILQAKIGDGAVIGAGAVVREDVPPGETWAGVPARRL